LGTSGVRRRLDLVSLNLVLTHGGAPDGTRVVTRELLSKADATKENVSRSLEKLSLLKNYGWGRRPRRFQLYGNLVLIVG
jgi:hypothetical protein